jgi:hypothetical protein
MTVRDFPLRRRQCVLGTVPPSTHLITTREVEVADATGRAVHLPPDTHLSVETASPFAVTAFSSNGPIWIKLDSMNFDAVRVDLPT